MVEALFNQPNYLAAKKSLDVVALRQEAIASNIANLETPGYKRLDVAPSFQGELERACAMRDARQNKLGTAVGPVGGRPGAGQ
jgi:flagellar basal-body rod protein FlgB